MGDVMTTVGRSTNAHTELVLGMVFLQLGYQASVWAAIKAVSRLHRCLHQLRHRMPMIPAVLATVRAALWMVLQDLLQPGSLR